MNKRWMLAAMLACGLGVAGCCHNHHEKGGEEEGEEANEVKMQFDQVPTAVKETLTREANGVTIKTVDKEEDKKGRTTYETDVMSDGKNWEIRVAPDGRLISKKIDNEEDEKPMKKGKEDDDDEKEDHKK